MGCHRSGTNLLYDTLLSAGGFAVYRGYLPVYKMLIPRFGSFDRVKNRTNAMAAWVRSKGFRRAGLDAESLMTTVGDECRSGGDFIQIVMSEIARTQNVARWAVYDPDALLYLRRIRSDIPEALFVHIIRDGRDVALSLSKMGGFKPFPWSHEGGRLLPSALYWEWMIGKGQKYGRCIPADYIEVHYEELVTQPRLTLRKLAQFLDHDLDYDRIQNAGLGTVRKSNSSFSKDHHGDPVNRWKKNLSSQDLASVEALVGECLQELGYSLSSQAPLQRQGLRDTCMRAFYFNLLDTKLWLKTCTPAGRLAKLEALELTDSQAEVE